MRNLKLRNQKSEMPPVISNSVILGLSQFAMSILQNFPAGGGYKYAFTSGGNFKPEPTPTSEIISPTGGARRGHNHTHVAETIHFHLQKRTYWKDHVAMFGRYGC